MFYFTLLDYSSFVEYVFTKCSKDALVSVVGHSYGAAITLRYALCDESARPISKAIAIAPPAFYEDDEKFYNMNKKSLYVFKLPESLLWLIRPLLWGGARDALFGPHATEKLIQQEREASSRNPVYMFKDLYTSIDRSILSLRDFKGETAHPLLLLSCECDKLCKPKDIEEVLYAKIKNKLPGIITYKQLKDCGHQCMQEDPSQTNKIIEDFLL